MIMDLGDVWRKLEEDKLSKPVTGAVEVPKESKHPIQKLKNSYKVTIAFTIAFLIGFIILLFSFNEPLVRISLALVIFSYVFFLAINYSMYKKIKVDFPVDQSLIKALRHTYDFISSNIRFQERVALFIYPVAGTAGFLMGGSLGSGDLDSMLKEKTVIFTLIIVLIVLTPICYFLTKWMYKISYGKCLVELKALINELEKPD